MEFPDEIEEKQFREIYFIQDSEYSFANFKPNRPGTEEVLKYPDTDIHRLRNPELYHFTFSHYECYIRRGFAHTWCGYVKVGINHPCWEDPEDFEVHGGITYDNLERGVIGFDTNHWRDAGPFESKQGYKNREYVISELKSLCSQAFKKLPPWEPKTHLMFPKDLQKYFWEMYKIWYLRKGTLLSYIVAKEIWIKIISETLKN